MSELFNFGITTIFAREFLEASIIIVEFRTLILRHGNWPEEFRQKDALRAVTVAASGAAALAILICAAVAIALAVLSRDFDDNVSSFIEGVSKMVAAICILQLSLKIPKWLGVNFRTIHNNDISNNDDDDDKSDTIQKSTEEAMSELGLTKRSIYFNVSWNIWREVAECGVFLIPFFLSGDGLKAIPVSAGVGTVVGLLCGFGINCANKKLKNKLWLAVFTSTLLLVMSTGLFVGGCSEMEAVFGYTPTVWTLRGQFWDDQRLPMTILKPFGYSSRRSLLQVCCFWLWFLFGCALHYRKYRLSMAEDDRNTDTEVGDEADVDNDDANGDIETPVCPESIELERVVDDEGNGDMESPGCKEPIEL